MKAISALFLALFAMNAQAELKAPGTILSRECARNVTINGTEERVKICFSNVTGLDSNYLTVGKDVWVVGERQGKVAKLDHVGFIGERNFLQHRLSLEMRYGQIKFDQYGEVESITVDGKEIRASQWDIMFHTMSL